MGSFVWGCREGAGPGRNSHPLSACQAQGHAAFDDYRAGWPQAGGIWRRWDRCLADSPDYFSAELASRDNSLLSSPLKTMEVLILLHGPTIPKEPRARFSKAQRSQSGLNFPNCSAAPNSTHCPELFWNVGHLLEHLKWKQSFFGSRGLLMEGIICHQTAVDPPHILWTKLKAIAGT